MDLGISLMPHMVLTKTDKMKIFPDVYSTSRSCNKNSRSSYVTHIVNSSLTLLGIRLCFEQINSDDEDCKQTESLKLKFQYMCELLAFLILKY